MNTELLAKISDAANEAFKTYDLDKADAYMICALYQSYLREYNPRAVCKYVGGGRAHIRARSTCQLSKRSAWVKNLRYELKSLAGAQAAGGATSADTPQS